ncbi:hypothetical protein N5S92_06470 [Aliarcobacter cryaerophilus]|jgi:hypothetical protein|uniref:ABC-three component systems C-terminal domain-containing protein n=3 Tax=Arcobacteraceae TaxID=2808963 RepID=A0AAU0P6C2_9BACT|nr:ABC-three component system protein [Aliarcobacter cryaerophilus]MCT7501628.1 hypothetical protein [Aliarcobacter cryaerophilus]UYF43433.1 hypothetical protein NGX11_00470 [Aliarcobacter cryaerophilus]WNL16941.1 hypothetical protein RJG54_00685 [Arcobacter sp. AZ-2023]WPD04048.1 hypothetical protein QUR79_03990 [Arcobacter sp. DSM 115972]
MALFSDEQNIDVNGSNNKTAGGNLFDLSSNYMIESIKHESAIGNILMGLSHFTTDIQYERPDTIEYTIEDKIDHNKLSKYKNFFDDYMENYNLVKSKVNIIIEEDLTFEKRLITYIKNKYIKNYSKDSDTNIILDNIIEEVEQELKMYSKLNLDDISGVHYIVFYVFAQCKIYKKPPRINL